MAKNATAKKSSAAKKTAPKRKSKKAIAAEVINRPLPSSWALTADVFKFFKDYWKTLLGIVAVYLVLNIIFASGLSNLGNAVADIRSNFNGDTGQQAFAKALTGFGSLVGSSGASGSSSASVLQSSLFVIESLAIIWALRQLLAGKAIGVKEAYYSSMYPLIPFLLVLFVVILQLLPISLGALVVTAVTTSAAGSITAIATISWLLFVLLAAWSFYMISSSIFALYIVTLPGMEPRKALHNAKTLVKGRRLKILPKIIYLPVFTLAVMALLVIPLIIGVPFLVAPVFYLLSMLSILFMHSYLYWIYRSLL